jgi:hypothetical protein
MQCFYSVDFRGGFGLCFHGVLLGKVCFGEVEEEAADD